MFAYFCLYSKETFFVNFLSTFHISFLFGKAILCSHTALAGRICGQVLLRRVPGQQGQRILGVELPSHARLKDCAPSRLEHTGETSICFTIHKGLVWEEDWPGKS